MRRQPQDVAIVGIVAMAVVGIVGLLVFFNGSLSLRQQTETTATVLDIEPSNVRK